MPESCQSQTGSNRFQPVEFVPGNPLPWACASSLLPVVPLKRPASAGRFFCRVRTVIKKKPGVSKLRVDGTVSILDFNLPPTYSNCTSGGPLAYSAPPCRQQVLHLPYIKKSLPLCRRKLGAE